ncbi:MAG: PHP domain-containing protein [Thermomicrobiales bacterium]
MKSSREQSESSNSTARRLDATTTVDLHTHSTWSDGLLSPAALVEEAAARGLQVLALTDHDTVAGIAEAKDAGARHGVAIVPGVELSVSLDAGGEVHLLGYFVDSDDPALLAGLAGYAQAREERMERMVDRLRRIGAAIAVERVRELAGRGTIGRPHLARALIEAGHAADFNDAFARYIGRGRPGFVPRPRVEPDDAIALVRRAGGVPVLAHPFSAGGVEDALDRLVPVGLLGMEVDYGEYIPEERETLRAIAARRGLIATGGSDYHGPDRREHRELGSVPVPLAAVAALRDAAGAGTTRPGQDGA